MSTRCQQLFFNAFNEAIQFNSQRIQHNVTCCSEVSQGTYHHLETCQLTSWFAPHAVPPSFSLLFSFYQQQLAQWQPQWKPAPSVPAQWIPRDGGELWWRSAWSVYANPWGGCLCVVHQMHSSSMNSIVIVSMLWFRSVLLIYICMTTQPLSIGTVNVYPLID